MARKGKQATISSTFERIRYERPDPNIARVVLARAEQRNAQDRKMLYEIDRAFRIAVADDEVKVIIIAADGPHFSSGHDLHDAEDLNNYDTVSLWGGFDEEGQAGMMNGEEEIYLGFCWRWRNLPKPTIVQVQGKVIAGGLMLVWPFDIVIASEDATFSDPVVAFGVNGHEFFTHAWELGQRKAKEMLFTGAAFSAEECRELGMVNHVVPREELESATLEIARRIAKRPAIGLRLAKLAVNQSLDAQGQWTAIQAAFSLHHVGHANARVKYGYPVEPTGAELIRNDAKGTKGKS
jgi:enoyl-CoA hydratase